MDLIAESPLFMTTAFDCLHSFMLLPHTPLDRQCAPGQHAEEFQAISKRKLKTLWLLTEGSVNICTFKST